MLDAKKWSDELTSQWKSYLGDICTNIRQLRLLMNDLSIAAPMVVGEVDKNDLIGIVAIQRFHPELYKAIYRHSDFVTYSQSWFKAREYVSEKTRKAMDVEARNAISGALERSSVPSAYERLIYSLFPPVREKMNVDEQRRVLRSDVSNAADQAKRGKRISHPDYFPIYFRYQVPETIVSGKEFREFVEQINSSRSETEVDLLLAKTLQDLGKGTLRRFDFLDKLSVARFSKPQETYLAFGLSKNSDAYLYDMIDAGEAALALNAVFKTAADEESFDRKTQVLARCITQAADDTFALRILTRLETGRTQEWRGMGTSDVDMTRLEQSFRKRMIRRYMHAHNRENMTMDTGDPEAFWRWAKMGPTEQADVRKFWRSFISQKKLRLGLVIDMFFSRYGWSGKSRAEGSSDFLTEKYLRHAVRSFEEPLGPLDFYEPAIYWAKQYIQGDFSNGVPMLWRERFRERPEDKD